MKDLILNNGVKMSQLGMGVYQLRPEEAVDAIRQAIDLGYTSFDTAVLYGNEKEVGEAIRQSGQKREKFFVTTKLWNTDQGYDSTLRAFEESDKRLGLGYVDLYLIHWPGKDKYVETYRAMERLLKEGRVRAIGVSNFNQHHLETLMEETEIVPAVNQIELHPLFSQRQLVAWCQSQGIAVEAWRPIAQGRVMDIPLLQELGKKYGKTPVQITLRWHVEHGVIVIPKSGQPERMAANADIWDFSLTPEEVERIDALDTGCRLSNDPETYF